MNNGDCIFVTNDYRKLPMWKNNEKNLSSEFNNLVGFMYTYYVLFILTLYLYYSLSREAFLYGNQIYIT